MHEYAITHLGGLNSALQASHYALGVVLLLLGRVSCQKILTTILQGLQSTESSTFGALHKKANNFYPDVYWMTYIMHIVHSLWHTTVTIACSVQGRCLSSRIARGRCACVCLARGGAVVEVRLHRL